MKSELQVLISRGYFKESESTLDLSLSQKDISDLLHSGIAQDRTKAAIIIKLNMKTDMTDELIRTLCNEKQLYCKIAICEALYSFGMKASEKLIPYLSKIGTNQHKKLPVKPFDKKSYPLPRDIIARTLVNIGTGILDPLLHHINKKMLDRNQLLEAIDVLGHISFNSKDERSKKTLIELYELHCDDNLIRWKLIRSFSAFKDKKLKKELEIIVSDNKVKELVWEAQRSLNYYD